MDKQKQIEEMAKLVGWNCDNKSMDYCEKVGDCNEFRAIDLYNAGYRKVPENAVVINKGVYERLCDLAYFGNGEETIRKETAEKFAERLKELVADRNCNEDYEWEDLQVDGQIFVECVDEICKEITDKGVQNGN